ncbi:uncharacterized protein DUF3560 [Bisgaardia hudsonensis]|uniref:Uncharacterized protein DUF3560 n=1 Tax=Bisgaardia hudsonensis TaxID=109472 RepID=A0A4R2N336_9PAST|nr:DUF3560 domain-containing protein [Bisgaardia hudsonensis]QLB12773.1 hypothetical protein A6A11_03695 [Bisgaardia hudsonensis]TCP14323.1 uncharacterized protein DUF3560 [Bisgaardia hudsonensis]
MIINTYVKFAPAVFVAKCVEPHEKGEIITLTSKYGNETEVKVHNLVRQQDGYYFYSFTRCDGMNSQVRAMQKVERYQSYADNAVKRSQKYLESANEGKDFLSLGEPIKIGHHSEKRHRALIERNAQRINKSVEEMYKSESYKSKITYWESMADKIDLSMPESLEFFEFKLAEAKEIHQELKANPDKRAHSYSLTYAKKAINELEKKVKLAKLLWA